MKTKEKEILSYLREGVVNISKIARELQLPVSTVSDRIKRLETKYVLKRSSLLDYSKVGCHSNSILVIKVESTNKKAFFDFLKKQKCVNSLYRTNSNFDFLVEVVFKKNIDLYKWIEVTQDKYLVAITEYPILSVELKERFVP